VHSLFELTECLKLHTSTKSIAVPCTNENLRKALHVATLVWLTNLEGEMSCKNCSSISQQDLRVKLKLTLALSDKEGLRLSPICIHQETTLVCVDCGYIELAVPKIDLEKLRKGLEVLD
jgi:hypothetical protein